MAGATLKWGETGGCSSSAALMRHTCCLIYSVNSTPNRCFSGPYSLRRWPGPLDATHCVGGPGRWMRSTNARPPLATSRAGPCSDEVSVQGTRPEVVQQEKLATTRKLVMMIALMVMMVLLMIMRWTMTMMVMMAGGRE